MKKLITLFALLALSVACTQSQQPGVERTPKSMLVSASGEVVTPANMASFNISINCKKMTIAGSRECLEEKSEVINAIFEKYGIAKKDITTNRISQSRDYDWVRQTSVFRGYISRLNTSVVILDLSILDELMADLLANEHYTMGYLNYNHSELDSLSLIAQQNALLNANNIADNLLLKMDESEKEILRLGNSGLPDRISTSNENKSKNVRKEFNSNDNLNKPQIIFSQGVVHISKNISVEYKIQ